MSFLKIIDGSLWHNEERLACLPTHNCGVGAGGKFSSKNTALIICSLTFTFFHFKLVLHKNQKRNHFDILLYVDIFYLLYILVSFVKLQPISLSQYFFYKIPGNKLFSTATSKSGVLL